MAAIFDRMNHLAFSAELTVMAQEVLYGTPDGGVCVIRGTFDRAYERIELHDGVEYSSTHPVLRVRLSDFAQPPQQGDRPTIDGVAFEVTDVQPDGRLGATLILRYL